MSAETVIKAALEVPAMAALIGTRIYPDARPQDDPLPGIVFLRTATQFIPTINNAIALTQAQMAVAVYGLTRASAEAIADAATTALLAAGLIPLNRSGGYEDGTFHYIVAMLFEHYQP